MFYYAYIDSTNLCTGVYAMPSNLSGIAGYITITEEEYTSQSVVGKYWDAETGTWIEPNAWVCNTDLIQYKETNTTLTEKLDEMDEAIANASAGADGEDGADGTTVVVGTTTTGEAGTNASVTGTLNEETNTLTLDFTIPRGANGESGSSASITAAEVLDKIKTVDGANSGLDADLLDGHNSDYFATAEQLTAKADSDHTHDYAATDHTHTGFAASEHTHTEYANATAVSALESTVAGKADLDHNHTEYAEADHTHNDYINVTTYANGMSGKANTSHTHAQSEISGLASALNGKADTNHTHSGYASSSHTHSDYLSTSGGAVSGNLNVTGIFRVNGQQAVYDSGSMVTLSTNNRQTMIAGSAIYSKVAISVSSDERLKENIKPVNVDEMVDFVKGIDVKTFNYIGNDTECVGVIAQEVKKANPDIAKYIVSEGEDGYLGVKTADLVFPLIAAVQQLAKRVEELEKAE